MKKYKRYEYWEALVIVRLYQLFCFPYYEYMWWDKRLKLIITDEI